MSPRSVDGGISNSGITAPATPTLVNVNTTVGTSGPVPTCDGVCVGGIVIATLAIYIGLLLSLGLTRGRIIPRRWTRKYTQRRTNSSTVVTAMNLNHRRSQTSVYSEPGPLSPYPEDTRPLPFSNDDDDTRYVLANNTTPDDQTSLNATLTNSSFDSAPTSVTSFNLNNTDELSMPPAPVIPTIPLPPVDTHGYLLSYNPISPNHENDSSIQSCSALVGETQSSESGGYNSNSNLEPIGSLGLILE